VPSQGATWDPGLFPDATGAIIPIKFRFSLALKSGDFFPYFLKSRSIGGPGRTIFANTIGDPPGLPAGRLAGLRFFSFFFPLAMFANQPELYGAVPAAPTPLFPRSLPHDCSTGCTDQRHATAGPFDVSAKSFQAWTGGTFPIFFPDLHFQETPAAPAGAIPNWGPVRPSWPVRHRPGTPPTPLAPE